MSEVQPHGPTTVDHMRTFYLELRRTFGDCSQLDDHICQALAISQNEETQASAWIGTPAWIGAPATSIYLKVAVTPELQVMMEYRPFLRRIMAVELRSGDSGSDINYARLTLEWRVNKVAGVSYYDPLVIMHTHWGRMDQQVLVGFGMEFKALVNSILPRQAFDPLKEPDPFELLHVLAKQF